MAVDAAGVSIQGLATVVAANRLAAFTMVTESSGVSDARADVVIYSKLHVIDLFISTHLLCDKYNNMAYYIMILWYFIINKCLLFIICNNYSCFVFKIGNFFPVYF